MKRKHSVIATIAIFCISVCACTESPRSAMSNSNDPAAQPVSDRGQTSLQVDGGKVSVEYGRPALKGRDIQKLISPGQEWRMGSNAATTLTTDVDLKFGDILVPKGKYVLKAKLDDQQRWLLLVQTEDQTPVAEVPLSAENNQPSAEYLTIDLKEKGDGGSFILHWGEMALSTDFRKA